jgi:hypothetical protein
LADSIDKLTAGLAEQKTQEAARWEKIQSELNMLSGQVCNTVVALHANGLVLPPGEHLGSKLQH